MTEEAERVRTVVVLTGGGRKRGRRGLGLARRLDGGLIVLRVQRLAGLLRLQVRRMLVVAVV